MTDKSEAVPPKAGGGRRARLWRYGPLILWMAFIFFASTAQLSASNTSRIIRPLLLWLFPGISEETLAFVHFMVRKLAHLTEYAILGWLAARAFNTSSHQPLRRHWFLFAGLLVVVYALSDELHQRFVPARTGSLYDSLIDITGGFLALTLFYFWRKVREGKRSRSEAEG